MDIIKEIAEGCTLSSLVRFKKIIQSPRSHKRVVLKQEDKDRVIYVPCKTVKMAQRYILDNYLSKLKPHDGCFSYTKGKSTVLMADYHIENKFFLHLDIKHYFDNMNWDVFERVVINNFHGTDFCLLLEDKESRIVKNILTFKGRFRQGSVTSPYVSNLYLFELDQELNNFVSKNIPNGKYTRYSDDIIISSSERIDSGIVDYIKCKLKQYKLRLNYKKVRFFNVTSHARVVGISITNDGRLTVPTDIKKKVKKMVYLALEKNEKCNFNVLYGYIYYLLMCDPMYYNFLQEKYQRNGVMMMERLKEIEKSANQKDYDC